MQRRAAESMCSCVAQSHYAQHLQCAALSTGGEVLVPAPVPVEIMARAWHDIVREDADNAALQAALRNLVSVLTHAIDSHPMRHQVCFVC